MNSLVIVLFLSGMVAMIMLRTLHKDIARYNQMDSTVSGNILVCSVPTTLFIVILRKGKIIALESAFKTFFYKKKKKTRNKKEILLKSYLEFTFSNKKAILNN